VLNTIRNVTGFVKWGLPHTFNSITLEDHDFQIVIKIHTKLKLSPAMHLCWCFMLTELQVSSINQSEFINMNRQSW